MKNHWIDRLRQEYLEQLLHESHVALWKLKQREENAIAQGNWASANIASSYIDSEKRIYARIKKRLSSGL